MCSSGLWHNAARRGQVAVMEFLHTAMAPFDNAMFWIHAVNRQGMTALHFGARSGRVAVVEWLLQQQPACTVAYVEALDARGQSARQAAVSNEHEVIVQLLDAHLRKGTVTVTATEAIDE